MNFINGKWIPGSGKEFSSTDPATNKLIWTGNEAKANEVGDAVNAAQLAFKSWSQTTLKERENILLQMAKILTEHKEDLAELISKETGKPLWESSGEVGAMIAKTPLTLEAYAKRTSQVSKDASGKTLNTRFKPHGVVAIFGPFNFPGHLPNGHIVPALLAGNTVVLKPSELTPAIAQRIMELWQETSIPNGVINLVQGGRSTGEALVNNDHINGLFFTGSAQTGKIIHKALAEKPQIILALEMGGNNPLIVTEASDLKAASYLTMQSAYLTAGQRCTCARRLIVPEGNQGDEFIKQLVSDVKGIQVGHYQDKPEPFIGSVITKQSALNILKAQEGLIKSGGKPLIKIELIKKDTGLLSPGIIDVTAIKNREDKEIFGPLIQLIRVKDFDAAIAEANNTAFGLSAGLICDNKKLYEKFYDQIRAGIVNWNNQLTGSSSEAPFGGVGISGNHRPSAYFAVDFCSYAVASMESEQLKMPTKKVPGLK